MDNIGGGCNVSDVVELDVGDDGGEGVEVMGVVGCSSQSWSSTIRQWRMC